MKKKQIIILASPGFRGLDTLNPIHEKAEIFLIDSIEKAQTVIKETEIIFAWDHACSGLLEDLWPQTRSLKWVQAGSAGVETLLFPDFTESFVLLTNATGLYGSVLAEFVVGSMIYFSHNLDQFKSLQIARVWSKIEVSEVNGKTLGIIGLGDVGQATAKLASCMNVRLVGCKRNPDKIDASLGLEMVYSPDQLLKMLPLCDYIVLCVPLTEETQGMIGEAQLKAMKPSAILINVARGGVVQEKSLIQSLQEGWIRGASLDVFEQEPLPRENPLWKMENVLLSPHSADYTSDLEASAGRLFVQNFECYLEEKPLFNIVNKKIGY